MRCLTNKLVCCLTVFVFTFSLDILAQNGLHFDGSADYVQTDYEGILGSSSRTFEAWVKVSSSATSNIAILDYGTNAVGSRNTFAVSGSNQLIYISGGTNANISSNANAVPDETWTHVAFVLNSGTGYLYVNGTQVGTGNLSTVNTPSGNTDLRIGQRVPGGNIAFRGSIDEVRVWDYARTATEISNDMGSEICELDSHLVAYHKLNHGIASGSNSGVTTSYDASGNGNDGTLQSFSLSGSTSNWVTGYNLNVSALTNAISATVCDGSYVSPSGNYTWTQAGTYLDTVESVMACDSILTITLSLGSSSSSSISEAVCSTYTSPSGNYTWTESGTYIDTIANAAGCDSIITIDLDVNNSSYEFDVDACNSYTVPSGDETWFFSGTYSDTIPNKAGCDSILTIHVNINYNTFSSTSAQACNSYTSPSGSHVWTESGIYIDTLTSAVGCDSLVTIVLTIDTVNAGIAKDGKTLSATSSGATYQWIDCDDNQPISGETGQEYAPDETGEYAVIVTQNGCVDTSECLKVKIVGIQDQDHLRGATIYPNPTAGTAFLDLGKPYEDLNVRILNAEGKLIQRILLTSAQYIELNFDQPAGLYTVQVYSESGYRSFRVMKVE